MEKIIEENKQGQSLVLEQKAGNGKKLFIESYGCQMNFSDSEIVASILANEGYNTTQNLEEADLVLVTPVPYVIRQNKLFEKGSINIMP